MHQHGETTYGGLGEATGAEDALPFVLPEAYSARDLTELPVL